MSRLVFLLLVCTVQSWAQLPGLPIKKTTERIFIDAEMNEAVWREAEVAKDFKQFFPFDSSYAKAQTEVRMTYDDKFIYVFAIMYNIGEQSYVTPSLRRDFRGEANDSFVVQFDTFKDNTNSFQFGINPFGVQREGLVANGGSTNQSDLSLNWDNKWYSQAKILDGKWVCEFAIPFKSLRYKHGLSSWNVNFYRINSNNAERSTWAPIPRNFPLISLAFTRPLIWDQPLDKPGSNVSLIPFIATRVNQNSEKGEQPQQSNSFGGDAKVAIGPALNLDLTVNPDFSQVEVDQQVTNLDRFEIFFPERRQFFLENADLFSDFGG
ncbi:MAG: carbohydrate binding family 9 domain-containing protein, partial [Cytophagales bacterium]|nr:carbohydrate binding family 9 domain-containing protein [Cytophagales bacterium]